MKRAGWLLVLVAAMSTACLGTEPGEVGLDEEFVLAPNQTVRLVGTNLTVGFRRVVADSRCPLDVLCVSEGTAGVELDFFRANTRHAVVLEPRPGFELWTDDTYQVQLLAVEPVPMAQRPVKPEDYRVRLIARLNLQ